MSVGDTDRGGKQHRTRMYTAFRCELLSLNIVWLHIGQRINTVEVRSSSLLVPTISFTDLTEIVKADWRSVQRWRGY